MSNFVQKISVLVTTKIDGGLKSFRSAVAEADGIAGKFKAGWKNATAQVGANAGVLAATAGTALFAFGVKAVAAFEKTAKAAIDMGKATGTSTEQASRWIAVGEDFGVTADQIAGAMGRIGKNLDAKAMADYGIATRDASGQAREANDVFLDVLDTINNTAPAERSAVASKLMGKGWQAVAPLLGKTRAEYEKMLSTVESGQVVTEKEAKKAEKMRLAQDKLNDALGEFTLAAGSAAAGLAPLLERIAQVVTYANELGAIESIIPPADTSGAMEQYGSVAGAMRAMLAAALKSGDAIAYLMDRGFSEAGAIKQLRSYRDEMKDAVDATQEMSPSAYDASKMVDKEAASFRKVSDALIQLQKILGQLDDEEAALNLADQFDETKRAAEEAFYAVASKAPDAEQKLRDAEQATIDLKRETIDYATNVAKLPPSKVTQIVALIDEGKLAEADALLKKLTATRTAFVSVAVGSGAAPSSGTLGNTGDLTGQIATPGQMAQESVRGGGPVTVIAQFVINDRVVQEITAMQEQQARGSR